MATKKKAAKKTRKSLASPKHFESVSSSLDKHFSSAAKAVAPPKHFKAAARAVAPAKHFTHISVALTKHFGMNAFRVSSAGKKSKVEDGSIVLEVAGKKRPKLVRTPKGWKLCL